jgi:spore germination protein GerM
MIKQIFNIVAIILLAIIIGVLVYFFYPESQGPGETMLVKVFFSNTYEDPNALHCDKVYFSQREIPKSQSIAQDSIKELLKGVNQTEKEAGFFTNINEGVKIQGFSIENRVAKIDFNDKLNEEVAGSCRVQAIRAQITETLKQFPEIDDVVISINDNEEDILQP